MKQLPFRCKKSAAGTTPDVCYFRALHKAQIITLTLLPVHTHIPHCTEIQVLSASQSIAFIVQKNVGCVSSLQQPRSSILTGSEHILTTVRSTVRFIIWCQVNVHKLCYACEMWTGGNCWKVQLRVVWESWNKAVSTCRNMYIFCGRECNISEVRLKTRPRAVTVQLSLRVPRLTPVVETEAVNISRGHRLTLIESKWHVHCRLSVH